MDHSAYTVELESENELLRRKLETLERDLRSQSPITTPKKPKIAPLNLTDIRLAAGGADRNDSFGTAISKLNTITLTDQSEGKSPSKTPAKKMRKLTARKWDLMDENEIDALERF